MARRKDKGGKPFLSSDLVSAAERLREDFEVAQMGPRVARNWDRYLSGGDLVDIDVESGSSDGQAKARLRVSEALRALGPGLGDVVLRVCCYLEGLEAAEKRMGWSARTTRTSSRGSTSPPSAAVSPPTRCTPGVSSAPTARRAR